MHITRALSWERLSSIGWDGLATLALCMAVITVSGGLTFLACWVIVARFARSTGGPASDADVILVLGARLNRGEVTRDFEARLDKAARLSPRRPVIVLGGMATAGGPTEAAAGRGWLIRYGLDEGLVMMEEASRNTLENLVHARELLRRRNFRRPLLITSRYHLARASILAHGLGISHALSTTEFPAMYHPPAFARSLVEALLINWYYVGRTLARLTRNRGMLARIT